MNLGETVISLEISFCPYSIYAYPHFSGQNVSFETSPVGF